MVFWLSSYQLLRVLDLKTPSKDPFQCHKPATGRPYFARERKAALEHAAPARFKTHDMLASWCP